MADTIDTGGGASIAGGVNSGGGGVTGRDDRSHRTTISIEARNAIDDLRTDYRILDGKVDSLQFKHFDMQNQIVALQRESRGAEPASLIDEQRRTNELLRVLIAVIVAAMMGIGILLIVGRL